MFDRKYDVTILLILDKHARPTSHIGPSHNIVIIDHDDLKQSNV